MKMCKFPKYFTLKPQTVWGDRQKVSLLKMEPQLLFTPRWSVAVCRINSFFTISNGTLAQTEKQTKKIFCFSCIHFPKIASICTILTLNWIKCLQWFESHCIKEPRCNIQLIRLQKITKVFYVQNWRSHDRALRTSRKLVRRGLHAA